MFFVKLDYVRLLAQSMRDRVGGDPLTLGRLLVEAVDELELYVPQGAGELTRRALERVRGLVSALPVPS
jgi:hypothetical protein